MGRIEALVSARASHVARRVAILSINGWGRRGGWGSRGGIGKHHDAAKQDMGVRRACTGQTCLSSAASVTGAHCRTQVIVEVRAGVVLTCVHTRTQAAGEPHTTCDRSPGVRMAPVTVQLEDAVASSLLRSSTTRRSMGGCMPQVPLVPPAHQRCGPTRGSMPAQARCTDASCGNNKESSSASGLCTPRVQRTPSLTSRCTSPHQPGLGRRHDDQRGGHVLESLGHDSGARALKEHSLSRRRAT